MEKNSFLLGEVKKIHLDIDCGELTVKELANLEQIEVEAEVGENGTYSAELNGGGKLHIRYKQKNKLIRMKECEVKIVLYLPVGAQFEKFKVEVGAGKVNMREAVVSCGKLKLDIGAGSLSAGSIKAEESLSADVGAGSAELAHVETGKLVVDCGVGDFTMTGDVRGNLDLECGVGNCTVNLEGSGADYDYDLSCGIGKIFINGQQAARKEGKTRTAGTAIGTIRLNCGVGKINLNTR